MPSLLKKIVAIVTTVTCAVWMMGPSTAQATTIEELEALIASLTKQLNDAMTLLTELKGETPTVEGCTITSFDRNLSQGMSGDDVKCLQIILNSASDTQLAVSGVGSAGKETNYFGPLTYAAVVKFQEKYADDVLAYWGLTKGTGYVGSTTRTKLNELLTAGEEEEEEEELPAGESVIQLAADTPASAQVAKGAQDVIFMKLNVCAADEANTISKIIFKRGGVAQDSDISYVKLYEGAKQVGSTQALNSTTHKATFSSLNWTIPANSCKVLTVKASIAEGATAGDTVKFSIDSASVITSTVVLDGFFPISSNGMTIAGIQAGALKVSTTTPAGGTKIAGGTEQDVGGFKFEASSSEGVAIHSLTFTEVGSSVAGDVSNIKIFYGATQVGDTVEALDSNGKVTFDLTSSPFEILSSGSKTLKVKVDIGAGVGVDDRTVEFELTDNTSVTAYGANSGGKLVVYGNDWGTGSEVWPQRHYDAVDIVLGSLTIADSTEYSPSAQDYAKGSEQNDIIAFKFTTGANEAVRITQIKLKRASSSLADSDVSNITLYDAETGEQLVDTNGDLVASAGQVSGYVTFGSYTTGLDDPGLFDIPKASSRYILVKADVSTGADADDLVLGYIINNPQNDVKADGLSSQNDLGTSEISPATQKPADGSEILHDIITKGTLTVQAAADTPTSATYAIGTSDFKFAYFDFISTGEDITVSEVNIHFNTSSDNTATANPALSSDVNNIRLYDGSTLLATDDSLSSGKAEFAINLTVSRNTTKTLKVIGDIPSTSGDGYLTAQIIVDSDITASGVGSAQTIVATATDWGSDNAVHGSLMTKGAPDITVKAAGTPVASTYIKNTAEAHFSSLLFTASTTESVKVTKVRIIADATSTGASASTTLDAADWDKLVQTDSVEAVNDLVGNVKLYDGSTQVGNTVSQLTIDSNGEFWYADFTGLSLVVNKGETKVIDVKAKVINNTSGEQVYFGISTTSSNVVAAGVQSGTSATYVPGSWGCVGQGMTLDSSGILFVDEDAEMPISAEIMAYDTATVGKWKFEAYYEDINISKLVFDVFHSGTATDSTSVAYATTSYEVQIAGFSTSGEAASTSYAFNASVNDGATSTCWFEWSEEKGNPKTDLLIDVLKNEASSSCASGTADRAWEIWPENATNSDGVLVLMASPAGSYYSLEITDYEDTWASNTADDLLLGLKYGGTETVGKYAGSKNSVKSNGVYLYDGDTLLKSVSIDDAGAVDQATFDFPSGSEIALTKNVPKVLTVKLELSDYGGAVEGSTIQLAIGTDTEAGDVYFQGSYIEGKGASSGTDLATTTILTNASTTANATTSQLGTNEMYVYRTLPTVSLNGSSPSGTQSGGSNKEVFRFDVANSNSGYDLNVNAIRFTLDSNTSTSPWDKTYKLYKSTDSANEIGKGISWNYATTGDKVGWVVIYPESGYTIGSGATRTYVLRGDTSAMTTGDYLTISIEVDDFYFDDGQAANAQKKVLNLPVIGNLLKY